MPNVDLDYGVIRRLFRSRPSSSPRSVLTNLERRAVASAAYCDDYIGLACLEDPLTVHCDLQDWDRHRRRGFDWEEIFN